MSQLVREDGCNAVMFAYGPTGTGKTHTMGTLGVEAEEGQGLLPRAVRQVRASPAPFNPPHLMKTLSCSLTAFVKSFSYYLPDLPTDTSFLHPSSLPPCLLPSFPPSHHLHPL